MECVECVECVEWVECVEGGVVFKWSDWQVSWKSSLLFRF